MSLLNIIFSEAYAQAAPMAGHGLDLMSFAPLVILFVALYFIVIRPQTKKAKEHREMLNVLRRGDRIVTSGGIVGTISKIENDNEVTLEIADGVHVQVIRSMIAHVLAKTQPLTMKQETTALEKASASKTKKSAVAVLKKSKQIASPKKVIQKKTKK